jgi:dimethylhistidine N-methyltransferase
MRETLIDVSDRLELIELPHAAAEHGFADDVRAGLSARDKYLSSKYFYDEVGSALFEAITVLPEYYLTRAETEILRDWGWEIVRLLDEPVEFFELGGGSATKTRLLIEDALRVQGSLRYSTVDISREALLASSSALVASYPQLRVRAYAGDYFAVLASDALRFERRVLALFLGSNIGNYAPRDARAFLTLVAKALRPGDGLLLGADRKKDAATLELAYADPAGVTSAFDKNVLARVNRELGADFDLSNFDHVARYDEGRGCVDSYLQARFSQTAFVRALGLAVTLQAGERIHTESSYKFDDDDIRAIAKVSGFEVRKSWQDAGSRFSVYMLVRTP